MNSVKECATAIEAIQTSLTGIEERLSVLEELANADGQEALRAEIHQLTVSVANTVQAVEEMKSAPPQPATSPSSNKRFVRTWMFSPDGGKELVSDAGRAAELKAEGWGDTPGGKVTVRAPDDGEKL